MVRARGALWGACLLVWLLAPAVPSAGVTPQVSAPRGAAPLRCAGRARAAGREEGAGPAAQGQAQEHRDEGDRLYKHGQYGDAVEAYTAALRIDGSVRGAFGGRAAALLMTAQYGAALHDARRAVDAASAAAAGGAAGDGSDCHAPSQGPRAGGTHSEQMHAHLLVAKTLLAMGCAEEASAHYDTAAQLAGSGDPDTTHRAALECKQSAREGVKYARSYDALIRKAFSNLHQTRDLYYVPVVGRWRSWRKASIGDGHDLPLGVAPSHPLG